jgi:hypothetical protein
MDWEHGHVNPRVFNNLGAAQVNWCLTGNNVFRPTMWNWDIKNSNLLNAELFMKANNVFSPLIIILNDHSVEENVKGKVVHVLN